MVSIAQMAMNITIKHYFSVCVPIISIYQTQTPFGPKLSVRYTGVLLYVSMAISMVTQASVVCNNEVVHRSLGLQYIVSLT